MHILSAISVDDEQAAHSALKNLPEGYDNIELVGYAHNGAALTIRYLLYQDPVESTSRFPQILQGRYSDFIGVSPYEVPTMSL